MPPNFKIEIFFESAPTLFEYYKQDIPDHKVYIKFTYIYNKTHEENYELSLNYIKNIEFIGSKEDKIEININEIEKSMQKIMKKI